jgi:hypothetical protein
MIILYLFYDRLIGLVLGLKNKDLSLTTENLLKVTLYFSALLSTINPFDFKALSFLTHYFILATTSWASLKTLHK